jgi:LysR family glycine cleavage system transcriptional activator
MLNLQRGEEIHVAATSDFADFWLKPRIGSFIAEHPHVLFCINGEGDAPLRIGQVDCEISFGPQRPNSRDDLLFRDFVLPISSPENTRRISNVALRERLEGFPLLHLDFYKEDPSTPNWAAWNPFPAHQARTRGGSRECGLDHLRVGATRPLHR